MDVWTALWYESEEFWSLYVMAIVDAVPYTIVYAVSNVLFLIILLKPFGRKLERVKIRYGL
jgi:energy-coupling factor transport system substrate-specific component